MEIQRKSKNVLNWNRKSGKGEEKDLTINYMKQRNTGRYGNPKSEEGTRAHRPFEMPETLKKNSKYI